MHQLHIEYQLDGPEPGYRFRPTSSSFRPETLRTVWRHAMPRGQGWADFIGARSLKVFQVNSSTVAVSEVLVTGQADEAGRRGIRQAEIQLLGWHDYEAWQKARIQGYTQAVRRRAEQSLGLSQIIQAMAGLAPVPGGGQLALSYPWQGAEDWAYIECLLLMMSSRWALRAARGWPRLLPTTSLALASQEESPLLAMPGGQGGRSGKLHVLAIG